MVYFFKAFGNLLQFYVSDDLALSNFLVYFLMHSFGHLCSSLVTIVFTHKCSNSQTQQPPASKGPYSQVGFSYDGDGKEETHFSDGDDSESEDEDDDDDEDFNSDDSNDEGMETIAKEFGVKRYGWLVYMDKKAKEEEKRQKEVIKGDPAIVSLARLSFGISSCFLVTIIQLLHVHLYKLLISEENESQGKKESFSDRKGKRERSC
jgi:hypothetical protein